MKAVSTSIVALLLGVVIGWRPDLRSSGEAETADPSAAPRLDAVSTAETTLRAEAVLGQGWRTWARRVESAATQAELEEIFHQLAATGDPKLRGTAGRLLGARWVDVGPLAAVRFLGQSEDGAWVLHPLLTEWALLDLESALAGLAMLEPQAAHEARAAVLTRLPRRDPDTALDFIRATGQFVNRASRDDWRQVALARPEEFASLIAEIETENLERGARYSAFDLIRVAAEVLAERDPEAALTWADGLLAGMRSDGMRTALRTWAERDPTTLAERIAHWKRESPTSPRSQAAADLLVELALARSMAGEDLEMAAAWLEQHSHRAEAFVEAVALKIARGEQSFEEVFDTIAGVDSHNDFVRTSVFGGMWDRMTEPELESAFDVLQTKPEGVPRTKALGGILRETLGRDPAVAVALADRVPRGSGRDALVAEMFSGTDLQRQGSRITAAVSALGGDERAIAIGVLFASDPEPPGEGNRDFNPGSLAETLDAAPASHVRGLAVERLALHWGSYDPAAAMEWAAGLASEEAVAATGAAARGWAPQDSFSLSQHLMETPASRPRDAATAALVESVREVEPDSAWHWTARIDDPMTRRQARHAVIDGWAAKNPDEARAAIEAADLPTAEREALRAALGP